MTTNARWIIGILLALVIGLGVGLAIVAGDDSQDSTTTVTTRDEVTTDIETTETSEPTETGPSGGVAPPSP